MNDSNITRKNWSEFRRTGLLLFINSILHAFGWAIVIQTAEDDSVTGCFPARVKYRGFDSAAVAESHKRIGAYLKDAADELAEEAQS